MYLQVIGPKLSGRIYKGNKFSDVAWSVDGTKLYYKVAGIQYYYDINSRKTVQQQDSSIDYYKGLSDSSVDENGYNYYSNDNSWNLQVAYRSNHFSFRNVNSGKTLEYDYKSDLGGYLVLLLDNNKCIFSHDINGNLEIIKVNLPSLTQEKIYQGKYIDFAQLYISPDLKNLALTDVHHELVSSAYKYSEIFIIKLEITN